MEEGGPVSIREKHGAKERTKKKENKTSKEMAGQRALLMGQ